MERSRFRSSKNSNGDSLPVGAPPPAGGGLLDCIERWGFKSFAAAAVLISQSKVCAKRGGLCAFRKKYAHGVGVTLNKNAECLQDIPPILCHRPSATTHRTPHVPHPPPLPLPPARAQQPRHTALSPRRHRRQVECAATTTQITTNHHANAPRFTHCVGCYCVWLALFAELPLTTNAATLLRKIEARPFFCEKLEPGNGRILRSCDPCCPGLQAATTATKLQLEFKKEVKSTQIRVIKGVKSVKL